MSNWWRQPWKPTGHVDETCQVVEDFNSVPSRVCGEPAILAYPAMGGGYMSLCQSHSIRHAHYCVTIEAAKRGEEPDWSTVFKREPSGSVSPSENRNNG